MSNKVITLIPGSFRPFCEHHNRMVRFYSDKSDKVLVIISNPKNEENQRTTEFGNVITAEDAKTIADLTIQDSGYDNVKTLVSECNPISTMMQIMSNLKDCDIILGVSKKDDDCRRFDYIINNFKTDNNIRILPVEDNAFEPVTEDESVNVMSAEDFRNNMSKRDSYDKYLASNLSDESKKKIFDLLNKTPCEVDENLYMTSRIFEELVNEKDEISEDTPETTENKDNVLENLEPQDITEAINITLDDDTISKAKCSIVAYNLHVDEEDEHEAYNPKKNPDKAVDIILEYPGNELKIEIFLDTQSREWDSWINDEKKLSPEQMESFFKSDFYKKLYNKLNDVWPTSDELFSDLINAINHKKYRIDGLMCEEDTIDEDDASDTAREKRSERKWEQIDRHERSASGRKYITPSDFGVKHDENEAYFCWPASKGRAEYPEFKWSQWADWKKIKPLARMRFTMGSSDPHVYGLTISPLETSDKNRGFRSYDLTAQPPLQYLSPQETQMIMDLDIVKKFLKNVVKRINKYLSIPDEEILERVNAPDKCTLDDIRKTKRTIRNALDAIRNGRADTYIYN